MTEVVRRVVSARLAELEPGGRLSISAVELSPDFHYATVWVSSLDSVDAAEILKLVQSHKAKLQHALASYLTSRYTPILNFKLDTSPGYASHIEGLIQKIHKKPPH